MKDQGGLQHPVPMSGCPVGGDKSERVEASSCPVQSSQSRDSSERTYLQYWTSWFVRPSGTNAEKEPSPGKYNPLTNEINYGHERQPHQSVALSTTRAVSTIPKGDLNPHHQIASMDQWVYPSEQQYYNAMKVSTFHSYYCTPVLTSKCF